MKKALLLALAGAIVLSSALYFPLSLSAQSVNGCYANYYACREKALGLDAPWTKVALLLTVCDLALGKCILFAKV